MKLSIRYPFRIEYSDKYKDEVLYIDITNQGKEYSIEEIKKRILEIGKAENITILIIKDCDNLEAMKIVGLIKDIDCVFPTRNKTKVE